MVGTASGCCVVDVRSLGWVCAVDHVNVLEGSTVTLLLGFEEFSVVVGPTVISVVQLVVGSSIVIE